VHADDSERVPAPVPTVGPDRVSAETVRPEVEPASGDRSWAVWLALASALALLRFVRLGEWGFWVDEAFTLHDVQKLFGLEPGARPKGNLLGLAFVGSIVQAVGSTDEWTARIGPAVLGVLGVGLTYWAFRPLVGRGRAAAAACVLAASSWHLYWSQNARFYTLAQDLALVSGACLLRSFRSAGVGSLALALVSGGLAGLAHLSGWLVPTAIALAPWLAPLARLELDANARKTRNRLAVIGLVAAIGVAPFAWELWRDYRAASPPPGGFVRAVGHYVLTTGYYVSPILGTAALVGVVLSFAPRGEGSEGRRLEALAALASVLVLVATAVAATQATVTAQYVFVLLPWIALLATGPLRAMRSSALARWAWVLVLVLPGVSHQVLYLTVRHGERPRWRDAYEYVWNRRDAHDLVIGMCPPVGEVYLSPDHGTPRVPDRIVRINPWSPHVPYPWARRGRRAWIVMSHEWLEDWQPADARRLERFLSEACRLDRAFPLEVESRDLSVWVYVYEG